jgi:hypothetical protein
MIALYSRHTEGALGLSGAQVRMLDQYIPQLALTQNMTYDEPKKGSPTRKSPKEEG